MSRRARRVCRLAALALAAAPAAPSAPAQTLVVYAFDQASDRLLRIHDANGDGDTLDAGEVTVFMNDASGPLGLENALGLAAVGAWRVLATDNFAPRNVLRLSDLNRDGDALDPGESVEWWNGDLPGGGGLALPAGLTIGPTPAGQTGPTVYLIDNNALNNAVPEALYRLRDADFSGTLAPSEVEVFHVLSAAGTSATNVFDVEFDAAGRAYVLDAQPAAAAILAIDAAGAAATVAVTQAELLALTGVWRLDATLPDLAFLAATDELVVPVLRDPGNLTGWLALRDRDGDQRINAADEWRLLWDEGSHAEAFSVGAPRDAFVLRDGSLLWADAQTDRIWRLRDLNADGDFQDAGETAFVYDSTAAVSAGQPCATQLLSLTAEFACAGDADDDGDSDLDDLLVALLNFGTASGALASEGDLNGDGAVNLDDLLILLANFGTACR